MEKVIFENGKEIFTEGYTQLFYTNHPLRPSCGSCRFAGMKRTGDFTVGDFWGVDKSYPELHDDRGVSLLFCNTERAVGIFEEVKDRLEFIETDMEHAASQPNLRGASIIPSDNKKFWSDFHKKGIKYCIDNWCPVGIPYRVRRKLRYLVKKILHINVRQLP